MKAKIKSTGELVDVYTCPANSEMMFTDGSKKYKWDEIEIMPTILNTEPKVYAKKVVQVQANAKISGQIK